jgi:hypothetical protein
MVYVSESPEQSITSPLMVPGFAGMLFTITANACAVDDPQALLAVTEMFPPEASAVILIELVVEVPVHPEGNVHV